MTVLANGFPLQQASVGTKANRPQGGQVFQGTADGEIAGVVDGGLGAQGTPFFEVLLDFGGLVADIERGGDALGDDAGAKAPGGAVSSPVD
jgi:hypothetical protein